MFLVSAGLLLCEELVDDLLIVELDVALVLTN